jgi:hypothetical protein
VACFLWLLSFHVKESNKYNRAKLLFEETGKISLVRLSFFCNGEIKYKSSGNNLLVENQPYLLELSVVYKGN